ncbi:MAG: response regulator [Acidobacteriota bacterium]
MNKLRIIIADDERPARNFLKTLLQNFEDAEVVGEAESGSDAIEIIKAEKPDLALLDLQMPEISGLEVVKFLRKSELPLVAFVTAHDEFAVRAFEVNAIDYLLKPVEKSRLRETLNRAQERLEQTDFQPREAANLKAAIADYEENSPKTFLQRIPIRSRDEIYLIPVSEIASIVADGELLRLTDLYNKTYTINFRLKDLETKLEPDKFVRLSRGALVNLEAIERISLMPGGTYSVFLKNGQEIASSRSQSRILREKLLKI